MHLGVLRALFYLLSVRICVDVGEHRKMFSVLPVVQWSSYLDLLLLLRDASYHHSDRSTLDRSTQVMQISPHLLVTAEAVREGN